MDAKVTVFVTFVLIAFIGNTFAQSPAPPANETAEGDNERGIKKPSHHVGPPNHHAVAPGLAAAESPSVQNGTSAFNSTVPRPHRHKNHTHSQGHVFGHKKNKTKKADEKGLTSDHGKGVQDLAKAADDSDSSEEVSGSGQVQLSSSGHAQTNVNASSAGDARVLIYPKPNSLIQP